jgi:deoxyribose-phosphate aldolase
MQNLIKDGVGNLDDYLKEIGEPVSIDEISKIAMASLIDHTLLKPESTEEMVEKLCKEADEYKFKSVCINPYWVPYASGLLKDSPVKICTVIGFPLGANATSTKANETIFSVNSGADEVDMVLNVGALKTQDTKTVEEDIKAVVAASDEKAIVKVILETCLLSNDEIELASKIALNAGAHFVKTSTGFSTGGATEEAIRIMRKTVGNDMGVKASGGVRDRSGAIKMLEAGATRIGASAGIAIITGGDAGEGKY